MGEFHTATQLGLHTHTALGYTGFIQANLKVLKHGFDLQSYLKTLFLKMLKRRHLLKMMKRRRRSLTTEKVKKRRNTVYLPEDLLVEILSRVPETSLARFRRLHWETFRLNLHGIHDNNVGKVISQFSLNDPLSSSSLKEVGIRHVIAMHHHGRKTSCLESMFRGSNVVGETRDWFIPGDWRDGTSIDGNTYWLTNKYSPTGTRNAALQCFDFTKERFGLVSLPGDTLSYNVFALSVTREEQNLCLLASSRDEEVHDVDVWMATKI
ncbi:hypothetical protein YC2023_061278 [Brassica napus]